MEKINLNDFKIAVVIPAYKVKNQIKTVIKSIPKYISAIYVIDDCCPEKSGKVALTCKDKRIKLGIRSEFIKIADNQTENLLSVEVEKVEDLGNYKLLTAKMGKLIIKSKINRETEVASSNVKLHIPAEKCCVYENEKLI